VSGGEANEFGWTRAVRNGKYALMMCPMIVSIQECGVVVVSRMVLHLGSCVTTASCNLFKGFGDIREYCRAERTHR
jgi:hypothetical protein